MISNSNYLTMHKKRTRPYLPGWRHSTVDLKLTRMPLHENVVFTSALATKARYTLLVSTGRVNGP